MTYGLMFLVLGLGVLAGVVIGQHRVIRRLERRIDTQSSEFEYVDRDARRYRWLSARHPDSEAVEATIDEALRKEDANALLARV
jgi:hypothetical protein